MRLEVIVGAPVLIVCPPGLGPAQRLRPRHESWRLPTSFGENATGRKGGCRRGAAAGRDRAWAAAAALAGFTPDDPPDADALGAAIGRLLSDPVQLATWYSGFGVTLYVLGMLVSAFALR